MEIKLSDVSNKISMPAAIHIQYVVPEATKHNIELLEFYVFLNKILYQLYPFYITRVKFILH